MWSVSATAVMQWTGCDGVNISSERDFQGLHLEFFKVSQHYNVFGTFFVPGILLTQGCGANYGLPEEGSTSITCQMKWLVSLKLPQRQPSLALVRALCISEPAA